MMGPRLALIAGVLLAPVAGAEDAPLSLADLEAYRAALGASPGGPASRVRFRDLWDRPGDYAGRPVRVEGRVARLFRQARVGEFPPLAEAWVVSEAGDPFCLVFPTGEGRPTPGVGAAVWFTGTFLRRLKYQGGDEARLAPLIVGPEPPSAPAPAATEGPSWATADWVLGLGAASMAALILARRHLSGPPSPPRPVDPPPRFVDGDHIEIEIEEAADDEPR